MDDSNKKEAAPEIPVTKTPVKKTPGKMRTAVGLWKQDPNDANRQGFVVMADLGEGATSKQVAAAVKSIGPGRYDVLVYRTSSITFTKVEKDVIS